jgi:hypothetical protein
MTIRKFLEEGKQIFWKNLEIGNTLKSSYVNKKPQGCGLQTKKKLKFQNSKSRFWYIESKKSENLVQNGFWVTKINSKLKI